MKTIRGAKVSGKRVLLRADLDIPPERVGGKGYRVKDDFRIRAALPTIEHLVDHQAKVIIIAHLGRPGGKVVEELKLDPVAAELSKKLVAIHKIDDCVGPKVKATVEAMAGGDVLLLENLRFYPAEEKNDPQFAEELALLADIYINDAFAASHRKHASIVGIPKYLPSYAGFRLEKETMILQRIIEETKRPLIFIVGGAKAETKAPLVKKLSKIADRILLGGTLMFETSLEGTPKVLFPIDAVRIDDIGPQTIKIFTDEIKKAKMVVWNGPLGKFEDPRFASGTQRIAELLATRKDAEVIVGGGDTIAALKKFGFLEKMDFVSAGGGAMLTFLAGEPLPGLAALND